MVTYILSLTLPTRTHICSEKRLFFDPDYKLRFFAGFNIHSLMTNFLYTCVLSLPFLPSVFSLFLFSLLSFLFLSLCLSSPHSFFLSFFKYLYTSLYIHARSSTHALLNHPYTHIKQHTYARGHTIIKLTIMHTHTYTHMHARIHKSRIHSYTHTHTRTYITHVHTHTHACTYTHILAHAHVLRTRHIHSAHQNHSTKNKTPQYTRTMHT